jgi:uncharacterized protein
MAKPRSTPRRINPPTSRFPLQIRRSPIHHLGVFACEAIPRRRIVIEYVGDKINYAEACRRHIKRGRPKRILFARLNRYWIIDAWKGNGSEFINHSCEPNLYVTRPHGHIFFWSRTHIQPGEELTYDYDLQRRAAKTACHCGAAKCRGEMNRPPGKPRRLRKTRRS